MELPQRTTAVNGPSTSNMAGHVVSCLERLQLLAQAATDKALRRESLAVLGYYALRINGETGLTWVTQKRAAEELGLAMPNMSRAVRQLEERGYMVRSHEPPRPDLKACTVYRLYVPAPTEVISPDNHELSAVITDELSAVITVEHRSVNPVTEPGKTDYPSGNPGGVPAARRERREPTRPEPQPGYLPKDWQPSEQLILKAMDELRLTREQVLHQTERFHGHQRSRGLRSLDWPEQWRLWMSDVGPNGSQRWRVEPRGGQAYAEHRVMRDNVGRQRDTVVPLRGGWR